MPKASDNPPANTAMQSRAERWADELDNGFWPEDLPRPPLAERRFQPAPAVLSVTDAMRGAAWALRRLTEAS